MRNLILFDQDTLLYRQSIYRNFRKAFHELGYNLIVIYDNKNNKIETDEDLFIGIDYSLKNCIRQIRKFKPEIIIQFIWLKYRFLFPFMIYCKLRGVKILLWSHGIHMQNTSKPVITQLHHLRQRLANAQIIYTPNELKYTVTAKEKVFIANNTLNFSEMPVISDSKDQLKMKYGFAGEKIILCVGRLNTHNRKVDLLYEGFKLLKQDKMRLVVVGPGVTEIQQKSLQDNPRCSYLGVIFDPQKINEIYKMSDVFVMPGGVGLAINHAFYHGLPVLIENVNHSPEAYYLKPEVNGFIFNKGDASDLAEKLTILLDNPEIYKKFSKNAADTVKIGEAAFSNMVNGFVNAINYLRKN